jgi:Leucine-rich repeat (LRR) protein
MAEELVDDSWMQRLWDWADKYNISSKDLPRDKDKLLEKRHLTLMMVYFGLNKIPADQWPKDPSLLKEEEKNSFVKVLLKKGIFPDEIGKLTQLEELCINYNYIERLPASIVNLKNLKKLCLCHNKILKLTFEQKLWVWELEKKGCIIECDDHLMIKL